MNPADVRTLVVARPDRIGDVVLSSSCFTAVRARFPRAAIHWLIDDQLWPLFQQHPLLAGRIARGHGPWWSRVRRLRDTFRQLRPDAVALLQPDRAVAVAAWMAGIPVRAGFSRLRCAPQFLTHAVPYRKSEGTRHEAEFNFDVLELLGVNRTNALVPSLSLDPSNGAALPAMLGADPTRLRRGVAFHLAAHGNKARVPLELLADLAGWLQRSHGLSTVLVGLETDPPLDQFARLAQLAPESILDLRGATTIGETAAILQGVALCVGRDSGPTHLAAALGCPTLALFVDVRPLAGPSRWRPLGPRVEVVGAEGAGFAPNEVHAAVERLLPAR